MDTGLCGLTPEVENNLSHATGVALIISRISATADGRRPLTDIGPPSDEAMRPVAAERLPVRRKPE